MDSSCYKSSVVFNEIQRQLLTEGPEVVKKVNGVLAFKIQHDIDCGEEIWTVDLKDTGTVETESSKKANCTIYIKDKHFMKVLMGRLSPKQAFMEGKIKLTGNMSVAIRLKSYQHKIKEFRTAVELAYPEMISLWTASKSKSKDSDIENTEDSVPFSLSQRSPADTLSMN